MAWIFLSAHLDDAVLSCGGLIASRAEATAVWTIFAGDPPAGELTPFARELHERWQTGPAAVAARRAEDVAACARLGAVYRHFSYPDCIYRRLPDGRPVIADREDLFRPAAEPGLTAELAGLFQTQIPAGTRVACPLTYGGHVDHRIVRAAAEQAHCELWYYPDYPYAAQPEAGGGETGRALLPPDSRAVRFDLPAEATATWEQAAAAYVSQISTFWADEAALRAALREYARQGGGSTLYRVAC